MAWFAIALLLALGAFAADDPKNAPPLKIVRVPASTESDKLLTIADFSASVIGVGKGKIVNLRTPKDDLLLLVVTDLVGDLMMVDSARNSLSQEVVGLPPNVAVGLMRAQEGLQVLLDPTTSREALEESLAELPVTGKAELLETVESVSQVAEAVGAKTGVRVAILYLTDSDVRNYREDFTNPVINSSDSRDLSRKFPEGLIRERISRLDKALAAYQTPMFIIHIARSSDRLNEAYQSGLLQIATTTGGMAIFCRSSAEVPQAISDTLKAIGGQYRVHVQLPAKAPKSLLLGLAVEGSALRYRDRYELR
ncbi:MAG TPA: hypothetical protein VEX68_00940 [Bryobacteraceae bacterium]|nr:hypothetical protein [Bryobacteraceae bacterium]